jgi:prephenate dehydrogenase
MKAEELPKTIQEWEAEAQKVLEHTGAENVVYAAELHDNSGAIINVQFYLLPLTDEELKDRSKHYGKVYALHKAAA